MKLKMGFKFSKKRGVKFLSKKENFHLMKQETKSVPRGNFHLFWAILLFSVEITLINYETYKEVVIFTLKK